MENTLGAGVGAVVTHADGMGERAAALAMLDAVPGTHPKTVAADKGEADGLGGRRCAWHER